VDRKLDTRPRVIIGPVTDDESEAVSSVNKCVIAGLSEQFIFVPQWSNRRFGGTRQAALNGINLLYFAWHLMGWVARLCWHRPAIAHYGMTSYWNFEKSLCFLRIARWFGARTVGHLHGGAFLDFWGKLPLGRRRFANRELSKLAAFVVLSDYWKDAISKRLEVDTDRIHVVNNPIDPAFEQQALQMPIGRGSYNVLALGVMGKAKGVHDLLDAARELQPPFTLQLVGPEREPGVYDLIDTFVGTHALRDQVKRIPAVRGREKLELFRQAGIFVLPSYHENFPLSVIEAAAAGLPIIVTPVGAIPEFFVDGESAIFVEPGNARQLAAACQRLLTSESDRIRLANAAREVFHKRLRTPIIMEAMQRVYDAVRLPSRN
jgi:glycosyltransferase involved in cell wall biosynthesis